MDPQWISLVSHTNESTMAMNTPTGVILRVVMRQPLPPDYAPPSPLNIPPSIALLPLPNVWVTSDGKWTTRPPFLMSEENDDA